MPCKLCRKQLKDWPYPDKPVCYFDDPSSNWNCATVNEIREICYGGQELPHGVDYQYCEDQKYATIKIDEIEFDDGCWLALWVSWYKNRGGTDALWMLSNDGPPKQPTEKDLLAIIAFYKK